MDTKVTSVFDRDAIVGCMRNSVVTSWIKMATSLCRLTKALLARKHFEAILRAPGVPQGLIGIARKQRLFEGVEHEAGIGAERTEVGFEIVAGESRHQIGGGFHYLITFVHGHYSAEDHAWQYAEHFKRLKLADSCLSPTAALDRFQPHRQWSILNYSMLYLASGRFSTSATHVPRLNTVRTRNLRPHRRCWG